MPSRIIISAANQIQPTHAVNFGWVVPRESAAAVDRAAAVAPAAACASVISAPLTGFGP